MISDHLQATFRQLLTMLALFDIAFITTASVSFSFPQLSNYWKVINDDDDDDDDENENYDDNDDDDDDEDDDNLNDDAGLDPSPPLPMVAAFHTDVPHRIHMVSLASLSLSSSR